MSSVATTAKCIHSMAFVGRGTLMTATITNRLNAPRAPRRKATPMALNDPRDHSMKRKDDPQTMPRAINPGSQLFDDKLVSTFWHA